MSSNSNQQFWDHPLRPLWTCRTPSWRFKFIGKQNVCPMSKCLWFGDTLDKAQKQINLLILLEKIFLAIIHLNPCSKFEKKWTLHQLDLCQQLNIIPKWNSFDLFVNCQIEILIYQIDHDRLNGISCTLPRRISFRLSKHHIRSTSTHMSSVYCASVCQTTNQKWCYDAVCYAYDISNVGSGATT